MRIRWWFALLGLVLLVRAPATPTAAQPASQPYTWRNVVTGGGGGYVPGIVFNPTQRDLIYARTDIGGLYRWDPANQRWQQLMSWVGPDEWNLSGVESVATDPVEPNRLYVAAGTYTNHWTSMNGAILRSTDYGTTFERIDLPFKVGGNMPGRGMGERLAIDPRANNILYLGARSGHGLWRSTDYGTTWQRVSSFPATGSYVPLPGDEYQGDAVGVVWITFDPRSSAPGQPTRTIYVGVADTGISIYRSTDAGVTWQALPGQPTGFLPHHGILGPDGVLYITYSNGAGPYDGTKGDVWKYNPATGAWTLISPVPSSSSDNYYGYGGLGVDQQRPGTLVVAALNSWWPDTIFFRSTDGGATWKRIWEWGVYPQRILHYTIDISNAPWLNFGNTNPVDPVPAVKLGWMVDDIEIDPFDSDRMLYGTGATVYGTTNLTAWDRGEKVAIKSMAVGIEEASVTGLISPPSGAHLYSTLGDIGGFRHDDLTRAPAQMYSVPYAGTYHSIDYAELNPSFLVRVGKGDPAANPPTRSSAFSYDGGASWFAGNSDPPGITAGGTVAAAADASRVVWALQGTQPVYSSDNGNRWLTVQGLPANARVASDRVNPQRFYAFAEGVFYWSSDGGASFQASAAQGLPRPGDPAQLKAVPGREGDVWLAGGSRSSVYGLWHSTDGGQTFTRLTSLDGADVVGFGKAAPGQTYPAIYISGSVNGVRGIFRSDDAGASWVRINDDQHQYASTNAAITGDPRIYGRVYVGTNGYGIVYGDPVTVPPTPTRTVVPTPTPTRTVVPTPTPTRTVVPTPTPTRTVVPTPTPTRTVVPTPTPTRTVVPTPTPTRTVVPTPTPTRTVVPTPSATAPAGAQSCRVAYSIVNQWPGGFQAEVRLTNTGGMTITGWELRWSFPNGQTITQLWNGGYTQQGADVMVSNASWNATIAPGATQSFGFLATWQTSNQLPSDFRLNGTACAVVR